MASESPFEWLAGGLFFGGGKQKGGIEAIDSCKDPAVLVQGISEALHLMIQSIPIVSVADGVVVPGEPVGMAASETASSAPAPAAAPTMTDQPSLFLAARLARLRFLLYDERKSSHEAGGSMNVGAHRRPTVIAATLQALTTGDGAGSDRSQVVIPLLLQHLATLPFESRKHVAAIFNYLLVAGLEGSDAPVYRPFMELFRDHVESQWDSIMSTIVQGHDTNKVTPSPSPDVVLHYGSMYRACLRHPSLYRATVGTTEAVHRYVLPFLDVHVHVPNFDISSDCMETLRLLFTMGCECREPDLQPVMADIAAEFLDRDYEELFIQRFNRKLLSETANYMTRRVALQILSTVLLTRSNYNVMIRFVASRENLILIMKLLRDTSPHITLDAFHVFKVFVANPNKPPEVIQILRDNKTKLCNYLTILHQDRESADTQFRDEKALIIATIDALVV